MYLWICERNHNYERAVLFISADTEDEARQFANESVKWVDYIEMIPGVKVTGNRGVLNESYYD